MVSCNSELIALMLPGFGCDLDSMLELDNALNGHPCIKHTKHMIFTTETSLEEMVHKIENKFQDSELKLTTPFGNPGLQPASFLMFTEMEQV